MSVWFLRRFLLLGLLLVSVAVGWPGRVAGQFPPNQEWRTMESPYFRVHFPRGLEALAVRTALRAEVAREAISRRFLEGPAGKLDVVLTDHTDISNGFASSVPRNRVVIYARPPMEGPGLNWFDEWVELVVTHELVHIHHLDHTGTPGRLARRLVGRLPLPWPTFPGWTTPRWITEGVATWYESALTDAGRAKGTWHSTVLRVAALEGALEEMHQTSGISPIWPGGSRPYIYGSRFMEWIHARHGEEAVGTFFREVAESWVPYRLNSAARRAFGATLQEEWDLWMASLEEEARITEAGLPPAAPGVADPEFLTRGAREVRGLRALPFGGVAFLGADGRSDAALHRLPGGNQRADADGGVPVPGATSLGPMPPLRVQGLVGFAPFADGTFLLAQYEFQDPWRMESDLYRMEASGRLRRITRGARLTHPDLHPDGNHAVAVQEGGGTNALVAVDLSRGEVTPLTPRDPDVLWAYPRWSPDGRWLAVIRRKPGTWTEVVVLDARGLLPGSPGVPPDLPTAAVVEADRSMHTTPAWSPDGRWLLWSTDRSGLSNLVGVEMADGTVVGPLLQGTSVVGAALDPAVDPGGEWLHYAHYTSAGWEVARVPFQPEAWPVAPPPAPWVTAREGPAPGLELEFPPPDFGAPYRPWRTLLPTWWEPLLVEAEEVGGRRALGPGVGLGLQGEDVVGRHSYRLETLIRPAGERWEWAGSYGFSGLGVPQLLVGGRQDHASAGIAVPRLSDGAPGPDTLTVARRQTRVEGGVRIPRVTFRRVSSLTFLAGTLEREFHLVEPGSGATSRRFELARPRARFLEGRMAVATSTARIFPFSVSPEDGTSVAVQGRVRHQRRLDPGERGVSTLDGSFREVTGQLRIYRSLGGAGAGRRVVALRVHGGTAHGPGADGFHFSLGGASGTGALPGTFLDPGGRALHYPVRGYREGERRGRQVVSASAELRLPVGLIHRGVGMVPLYGQNLSASLWWDGGAAWGGPAGFPGGGGSHGEPRRFLHAAGGEVVVDGLAFFAVPLTLRLGVATPLETGRSPSAYLRFGRSF